MVDQATTTQMNIWCLMQTLFNNVEDSSLLIKLCFENYMKTKPNHVQAIDVGKSTKD